MSSSEVMSAWRRSASRVGLVAVAVAFLASGSGLPLEAQGGSQSNSGLTVLEVRPNIYMIAGAGANIAVHIGRDGVVMTDTGTAERADLVLAEIKRLTTKPIRMIVNTSADPDHVGGNAVMSRAGQPLSATIPGGGLGDIGARNYAPILAEERVLFRMTAPTGQPSPYPTAAVPTSTFSFAAGDKQRKMYLNAEPIQVIAQPAAHTDGDSIVYFRKADVLVTGDIFDMTRFPVIDAARGGSIDGVIDSLNRIVEMTFDGTPLAYNYPDDGTLIIPGHGQLSAQSEVVDYRDMVTIVRDRVQALMKEGKTLAQIQEANPTQGWRKQYGADSGDWTTAKFVETIYRGLMGPRR